MRDREAVERNGGALVNVQTGEGERERESVEGRARGGKVRKRCGYG